MDNNEHVRAGNGADVDKCRDCKERIPSGTVECPACGFNPRRYARWLSGLGILIAGVIIHFLPAYELIGQGLLLFSIFLIPGSLFVTATTGSDRSET